MSAGANPSQSERRSGNTKRIFKLRLSAFICIIATIILTTAFLVFIISLALVKTSLTRPKESSACIPCDKMKYSGQTNARRFAFKRRDDGMCCSTVEGIAQMMFLKEMTVRYDYSWSIQSLIDIAEEYADCERETNDKQAIAKVVGIVQFKPSNIIEGQYKVLWNKNGRTFVANNIIHLELEGEIFVRQTGYYIVSSQLNLRRRKETNETRPMTFIHNVYVRADNYGETGVLTQTKNSIGSNDVYFTSFLSAVFRLKKYVRLSVSVSHPEWLEIDNSNDHFLVYYTYNLPN